MSCSSNRSYQYEELAENQIRILELFPGTEDSPLRCSFKPAELYSPVRYEAVSYVWGDANITDDVECDGGKVSITVNLVKALRIFRQPDKTRILWVDGLCINQKNAFEKATQVGLMGLIYWKAEKVLIWLGDGDDLDPSIGTEIAVDMIRVTGASYRASGTKDMPEERLPPLTSENITDDMDTYNRWMAVSFLFWQDWFTRVWTVQELGLAADATYYYGKTSFTQRELIDFTEFLDFRASAFERFYNINRKHQNLSEHYRSTTRGIQRFEYGSNASVAENFLHILEKARGLNYTDPRDRVYAFLGHPSAFKSKLLDSEPYRSYPRMFRKLQPFIQPNYDESNEVKDVFLQLALAVIEKYDIGPELFSHVRHDESTIADEYPSWVPRWDLSENPAWRSDKDAFHSASSKLSCSTFEITWPDGRKHSPQLRLKAFFVDRVTIEINLPPGHWSYKLLNNKSEEKDNMLDDLFLNPLEQVRILWENIRPLLPQNEFNDETDLAMTLTAGRSANSRHYIPADEDLEHHFASYCSYRLEKASIWGPALSEDEKARLEAYKGDADGFAEKFVEAAANKTFFCTEEGLLGIGPRILQEGDQCWIPVGSKIPVILREVELDKYKILGGAYLHGVMNGYQLHEVSEDALEEAMQDIILC